ncbi:hypothetical protein Trydic_g10042 [Trypoxylus dichotomus]
MWKVACLVLAINVANAEPGIFDAHSFDASLLASAHAPIFPAVIKAPVLAPAPIISAPIVKAIAPAPIIKAVAPATSYATVTQFHVTHPVVKTVLAPQPILKTLAIPASLPLAHDFHGFR